VLGDFGFYIMLWEPNWLSNIYIYILGYWKSTKFPRF
jgi:hypothetical protein